tara:strand:- start:7952 stop:8893 length:942 start_codon:yes stop_codon:yes gene_type:complete
MWEENSKDIITAKNGYAGVLWTEKYRPSFDSIIGQDEIVSKFEDTFVGNHIFYSRGAGTGKTSLAYALAEKYDSQLYIFNASSKRTRGIDFIEEEIIPLCSNGYYNKIILLDEADQLTPAAQSALKGVMEDAHAKFILTCNDLSKITAWIQSRCTVHYFHDIPKELVYGKLLNIASLEGSPNRRTKLHLIAEAHEGDLRAAINALQVYYSIIDDKGAEQFLLSLKDDGLNCEPILKLCFVEKDYEAALKLIGESDNLLEVKTKVKEIFNYAVNSSAKPESKLKVIDAAVTAERDLLLGVDPRITLHNFVRLCI